MPDCIGRGHEKKLLIWIGDRSIGRSNCGASRYILDLIERAGKWERQDAELQRIIGIGVPCQKLNQQVGIFGSSPGAVERSRYRVCAERRVVAVAVTDRHDVRKIRRRRET